jgi:alpha-L-rhamnosidase
MFGSVSQWFIRWLGGIQPQTEAIGFDRILIRPQAVAELKWVKSSYNSVRGRIESNWLRDGDQLRLELMVPANTTATVFVPAQAAAQVTESGKPADQSKGVKFLRMESSAAVYGVGSGTYRFQSTLPEDRHVAITPTR